MKLSHDDTTGGLTSEAPSTNGPYDTRAGIVVGAHGVQGTLKVKPVTATSVKLFTPKARDQNNIKLVWLGHDVDTGRLVTITSSKRQEPKDVYLLRIKGIDDRTAAEKLIGQSLFGKSDDREILSEDEFFVEDLIGLAVSDRNGVSLGNLVVVHSGVANDVYETDQGVLIPAVKAYIDSIDLSSQKMVVFDACALAME